ncbi:hypothetical protein [Nocardioides sp. Iso805N]|uniref:hypothetical protein n=1 Tax=Nocardioides sp. Iso805N TaxID=1283287 RepID=UPI00036C556E|nr:hypothetical protein [Nocardioides sp. Iso805N]
MLLIPLLAACSDTSSGQNASCRGPYLDDQSPTGVYGAPAPTIQPGRTVTIYGHWYTDTCNDTSIDNAPLKPLPAVQLTLRMSDRSAVSLGRFVPDGPDMGFKVSVRVPTTAPQGAATITDDLNNTYRFTVAGSSAA